MAQEDKVDLAIIGAGPAGIAAAQAAAALNAKVVLIEAGELGGVSHNWGTLPAQALTHAAERAHQIRTAKTLGLAPGEPRVNFGRINARIRDVVEMAAPDISDERLKAQGISLVRGKAKFTGRDTIAVDDRSYKARNILIATGSRPLVPEIPGMDDVPYFTPETIFELNRKPGHLVVVGGGGTGLALAQAHLRLGAKVTVIDMVEPLADIDHELAEAVLRRLRGEGLEIRTHTGVVAVATEGEEIAIDIKTGPDEERIVATHLLFATGRRAVLDELELTTAGIRLSGGLPQLRAGGRTTNRRVRIVGDAAGGHGAHAARHGGERAVAAMLGGADREAIVPNVIHTRPAIVQIGPSEREARNRWGDTIAITRAGFAQTDAARAAAEPHGHIKMITRADGRIVSVGMVGPAAPELAPLFALAISLKLTPHDLAGTLAPHPTFGEAVSRLVADYARHHPRRSAAGWGDRLKRLLP
ncbi:FAD-dependent oxidoreductase [Pelagibacterium luteolum]|uniref:FAD-dependent oxidoreductase n=1 Tax=Pelagibacterium luteolum TaxID=440168 RepID=UPI0015A246D6|nr:FAD-dependent oxidoreductase [Pelagibacterium luteolum]